VGIGGTGLVQLVAETLQDKAETFRKPALLGVAALAFAAVPGWMLLQNYDDHDRSGRYVAPDYAYNMLQSTAENAILFTNGDNDTFPLWYLQEVEGIRRDVRVVNLSLLNTPWYVKQLKNQWSRESAPLPISLSDDRIEELGVVRWTPREVALPVDRQQLLRQDEMVISHQDTSQIESPMRWQIEGRPYSRDMNVLYGADVAALDILRTNAYQGWTRPVYFAVTVSPDGMLNLQDYFQLEGQAFRVVPIKHNEPLGRVVPEITPERLQTFRFTNLDDPDVYYDENIRNMVDNYRNIYAQTAETLGAKGLPQEGKALLDTLMTQMPFDVIPGDERSYLFMARAYQAVGDSNRVVEIMQEAEPLVLARLERARSQRDMEYAAQFVNMIRLAYLDAQAFEAASAFNDRIADLLGDDTYRRTPEEMRQRYRRMMGDTTDLMTPTPTPSAPGDAVPEATAPDELSEEFQQ
jgi:hypothetical protein